MPSPKEAYRDELEQLARRYLDLDDEAIRATIRQLQQLRRSLTTLIGETESDFTLTRLSSLLDEADRLIEGFRSRLAGEIKPIFDDVYRVGSELAVRPLVAANISVLPVRINTAQLNALTGFSARLITNISEDIRTQINRELRTSVIGAQTPFQAMKNITNALGIHARDGIWGMRKRPEVVKGVAARAEAIFRTENNRILNLAHRSQQLEMEQDDPGVIKSWIATGDRRTRDSHLQAHLEYMRNPIGVNEAFIVGGQEMQYPGDPAGGPAETINCRCTMATTHVELGPVATSLDDAIRREVKKRADAKQQEVKAQLAQYRVYTSKHRYGEAVKHVSTGV